MSDLLLDSLDIIVVLCGLVYAAGILCLSPVIIPESVHGFPSLSCSSLKLILKACQVTLYRPVVVHLLIVRLVSFSRPHYTFSLSLCLSVCGSQYQ